MEGYREFILLPALGGLIRTVSPLITGLYLKRPGRYNVTNCPETQPLMTDDLRLLWIASMVTLQVSPPVWMFDLETHPV